MPSTKIHERRIDVMVFNSYIYLVIYSGCCLFHKASFAEDRQFIGDLLKYRESKITNIYRNVLLSV